MSVLTNYRFGIEIAGVIQAYCQTVQPPVVEHKELQYGTPGNSTNTKVPGGKTVGDLVLTSVVPETGSDPLIWTMFEAGIAGLRPVYISSGFLIQYNSQMIETERYLCEDIWIKKLETSEFNSNKENSEKTIRTMTWSVGDYYRVV
ncbi:MAG: hypothetical protein CL843_09460 [Crocinitomicaceae bacterium]|nr:hypothetical protein [Crocinitomicaceae bacterium]|tara:strand:+ start:652 stop:1089 length:438 start_codon:yes stop_codon:yes gene_type:complete